jgi:hypothetical protein
MRAQKHGWRVILILVFSVSLTPLVWGQKPDTTQDQKEEMKVTVKGGVSITTVFRDSNLTQVRGGHASDTSTVVQGGPLRLDIELSEKIEKAKEIDSVVDDLQSSTMGTVPNDTPLIKDMPHHGHISDTPYEGYWIVNTGDVPMEVSFIDKDGARTVIPEFRPGLGTGIPLNATNISLQPVGEGKFSARIEKTDETTIVQVNTPGTYVVPEVPPSQPVTPAVSAFDTFDVLQSGFDVFGGGPGPQSRDMQSAGGAPSTVEHSRSDSRDD